MYILATGIEQIRSIKECQIRIVAPRSASREGPSVQLLVRVTTLLSHGELQYGLNLVPKKVFGLHRSNLNLY